MQKATVIAGIVANGYTKTTQPTQSDLKAAADFSYTSAVL